MQKSGAKQAHKPLHRHHVIRKMRRMWPLYVFLLFPVVHTLIFSYFPMYGIQIAFKNYRAASGIWDSPWNDFRHFRILFSGASFPNILWNTIYISLTRILFGFPAPILFAILMNEITHLRFKKIVQTVSYLPHFMSWVVLGGIIKEVLSPQRGALNALIRMFGGQPVYFLTESALFVPILIVTAIWSGVGWGAIIYLASMSSIDPGLYEAAEIDGANRLQKAVHITIPCLIPIIVIQFILSLGGILNGGFDQIFNLMNAKVMGVAEIIDTYVYRIGLQEMKYDLSTAVGLFKNVVGVVLIAGANAIIAKYSEYGIW